MNSALLGLLSLMLLGISGLAIDGGQLFIARRDTQAIADAAARAGAAQIDEVAVRTMPDEPVRIEPFAAANAVEAYVADRRAGAIVTILAVDPAHIVVRVTSAAVPVTLLQLAGVGSSIRVQAVGEAAPETGITQPGQ